MNDATMIDLPLEWDSALEESTDDGAVHSIPDALILSLSNLGRVDIEYIARMSGEDTRAVIRALRGSIYQNPDKWGRDELAGWETAEEYLSGNLMRKLRRARDAERAYEWSTEETILYQQLTQVAAPREDFEIVTVHGLGYKVLLK